MHCGGKGNNDKLTRKERLCCRRGDFEVWRSEVEGRAADLPLWVASSVHCGGAEED